MNTILKVRVVKEGDDYFPQYKWGKSEKSSKTIFPKTETFGFSSIFEDLWNVEGPWYYIYNPKSADAENKVSFQDQQAAIIYAKRFKEKNQPTVVWEDNT